MQIISPLLPSDWAAAYTIEQASHLMPWSEKIFFSHQNKGSLNFKVEQHKCLIGFAITQIVLDEASLLNIAIDPLFQNQGYGKVLLRHLIEHLQARGIVTLWLEVRISNHPALTLYRKLGFNEVSVRKGYYPAAQGREDAIVMALSLCSE